ncbi:MAG: hypothetical protein ABJZ55_21375 [Fuerstiella sp.]
MITSCSFQVGFVLGVSLCCTQAIGQTVEPLQSNVTASFRGISVVSDTEVWISGSEGTVIHSTDSGNTFSKITVPHSDELDFRDIEVLPDGSILLMSIGNGESSKLFRSSDGGKNWNVVLQNQDQEAFFDGMAFHPDGKQGAMFGDPIRGLMDVYLTEDGGVTWNRLPDSHRPKLRPEEFGFAASGTGINWTHDGLQIATGGSVARIHRTTSKGRWWESMETTMLHGRPSAGIFSMAVQNQQIVIVGGDYLKPDEKGFNVAISQNGGRNLHVPANNNLGHKACVRFVSQSNVVTCGRTGIDISNDSGKTWTHLSDDAYYTLDAKFHSTIAYLAGPNGQVGKLTMAKPSASEEK